MNVRRLRSLLFLTLTLCCGIGLALPASAQQEPAGETADSVDRDYGKDLPRIPPLAPAEAIASFEVADGFAVELVASEPTVVDPVAMAFDEDQRLYVIEMRGYSEQDSENLGRVRLLEDRDGDGFYEFSRVFAEGLSWPTAIACFDSGVFVGAAPTIQYLKDTDGDGRADQQQLVFQGFGKSNVQGLMNSFTWGLDHRIHVAVSSSGAELRGADSSTEALSLRGRDFSFDPRTLQVRPESGGGQHGLSFNRWGVKFVCSNSDHLQQVMFEDRYAARNPYQAAPPSRVSIASDGPQADVYRASPVEPWRIIRTRLRAQQLVPGPLERGGLAAGYFTGATGVTLYTGDNWPSEFLDWAIIGDVGSNLVHRKQMTLRGTLYQGDRFDRQSEFLRSKDIWFRPVQFANGPDGTLYVLDMYREVIEHPKSLPPMIKKHLDLTSGRDRGRIYRVRAEGKARRTPPKMSGLSDEALVSLLSDANQWTRETAARVLWTRDARTQQVALAGLAQDPAAAPEARLQAMYLLQAWNALNADVLQTLLQDPHPVLRRHAVRLAEGSDHPAVREAVFGLVEDDDAWVRLQLAYSLGEFPGPAAWAALSQLASHHADQAGLRDAALSSLNDGAGEVLSNLIQQVDAPTAAQLAWIDALSAQIGKQQHPADVARVLQLLQDGAGDASPAWNAVVRGLRLKEEDPLRARVAAATSGKADAALRELALKAAAGALDDQRPLEDRLAECGKLILADKQQCLAACKQLLASEQPQPLQLAALRVLAQLNETEVAELVLAAWPGLSPKVRLAAAELLFAREHWVARLLDEVEAGAIARADLDPIRISMLRQHEDPVVRDRAAKLFDTVSEDRIALLQRYQAALDQPADSARGRLLFAKHCASCHRVEGVGHELGPNLAAMKSRGPEAILTNVLDPNREVNPQYLNFVLQTKDGRSLSGMISQESATSIELKRAENKTDTVLRVDIDVLKSTGNSLMPEGLVKEITPEQMADLLAYLQSL